MTTIDSEGVRSTWYLHTTREKADAENARHGIGPLVDSRELVREALRRKPGASSEELSRSIVEDDGKRLAGTPHFTPGRIEIILFQIAD